MKIYKTHELKVWSQYFKALFTRVKKFEIRKDDRKFEVNDALLLREWSPLDEKYTGTYLKYKITYKVEGGKFGIEKGYCCLGIEPIEEEGSKG